MTRGSTGRAWAAPPLGIVRVVRLGVVFALLLTLAACGRTSIGTATAAPGEDVRGGFGEFLFAAEGGPDVPLGPIDPRSARDQVARSQAAVDLAHDDAFGLAIVATFPTADAAADAAADLRDLLAADEAWFADRANAAARAALLDPERDAPISPPAAAWVADANLAAGTRGLGWAGRASGPGRPEDAVWTIGRVVVVTGLKAETIATPDVPPIHPIAHRWAAAGADVLIEGDRFGEGAIVTDLACRPRDGDVGQRLRDAIGDQVDLARWSPTPPWVAEPTADQALARREIARYLTLAASAAMDPAVVDLYQRIARTDGPDRTALMDELTARVLAAIQRETSGRVDPAIAALIARQPTGDAPDGRAAWDREVGALIGAVERRPDGLAPTADATGPVPFTGSIRLADGRLEIGWLTLGRASTGLPLLAAWLTERGCGELTIRLTDADAVGA